LNVFFQEELSIKDYAKAIVDLIGFKGRFDLCLDRSNWKFGDKDTNYLVLSWRINKKISLPLMFVDLDKAGNSNTAERLDLLEVFNDVFGFHRIKSLMADREFIGKKWFKALNENKITYFIRIKENTLLPWGKDNPIQVKRLFQHLKWGQNRLVLKEMYGHSVYFAGTPSKPGELVIVMSNQDLKAKQILDKYRDRWSIGVSREGHISKSVKVRPRLRGSRPRSLGGIMARKQDGEALRQHLRKEDGQSFRL
jgi:hypothetical protein